MQTSRRLLLLLAGLALFGLVFAVYNRLLGRIDGLPELPAKFLVRLEEGSLPIEPPNRELKFKRLLRQAFGDNCPELKYSNTFAHQGLVLATEIIEVERGRLKLSPLSMVMFGKVNPRTEFPEINTVHCDAAWLTFDRPINSLADTYSAKLVAADFQTDANTPFKDPRNASGQKIHIVHNHGTPQLDDDVILKTAGPIRFRDAVPPDPPQVTTDALIEITDHQARPPHVVTAQGLKVILAESALRPERAAPGSSKKAGAVRRIELPSNVDMRLTLDGRSGFPGTNPAQQHRKAKEDSISRLWIHTLGSFSYDVAANTAAFENAAAKGSAAFPDQVEVVQMLSSGKNNRLKCDRIDLRFRGRAGQSGRGADPSGLEIEEVNAAGKLVELAAESHAVHVTATHLAYFESERRTTISGSPVVVVQEGQKLQAPEIDLFQHDSVAIETATELKPIRVGAARGGGIAFLTDARSQRSIEVRWEKSLELARAPRLERVTITGDARLFDRAQMQSVGGDQIQVWIEGSPSDPQMNAAETAKRIRRIEVAGKVQLDLPDMRIRQTESLTAAFEDAPDPRSPKMLLPEAPPAPAVTAPPKLGPPQSPPGIQRANRRRPIFLRAKSVETTFVRAGNSTDLRQARCTGAVYVRQEPADPKDRGVEAHCHTLVLTHTSHGNILRITGRSGEPARTIANEMTLLGTQMTFNQIDNVADVEGRGSMRLLVGTTFQGEKLARPEEAVVYWNNSMTFNGSWASFVGGVQAEHNTSEVLCPRMDVYLDRRVDFQQVERKSPELKNGVQPQISRVVCHRGDNKSSQPVTIRESTRENGKLVRFQQIEAPVVVYSNESSVVEVEGPGEVRLFQPGSEVTLDRAKITEPDRHTVAEMKLTRIRFQGRMQGHTKDRWAKFFDDIRVVHIPTDNPLTVVNENRLPQNSFTMRCKQLVARTRMEAGKSIATMSAIGKAEIVSETFSGRADQIDYDDGKDQQVIFKSTGAALAALNHTPAKGQPAQEWLGRTIFYWRKTNQFKVVEAAGGTVPQ